MSETPMPFEGNLIRAQDYAPCGCKGTPHWVITADEHGVTAQKACPGRVPTEPFTAEDGAILGHMLVKGRK